MPHSRASKAELLTWSGISIGKIAPHHTTTTPYVPLQFRAIQAIQYYVNSTVRRRMRVLCSYK